MLISLHYSKLCHRYIIINIIGLILLFKYLSFTAGYFLQKKLFAMSSLEVTFRNSLDEDSNIESWIDTASNFKNENSAELLSSNLKKNNVKVDKENIISRIYKGKKCKKKRKFVYRELSDTHGKIIDISSGGRTSSILKKN